MKITSIKTHLMGIQGAGGFAPSRNWIFIEVHTDEGITGIGEATTEYHEHAVVAMIEQHLAPLLVGQNPTRVTELWQQMQRFFWWRGGVVASSAAAQQADQPPMKRVLTESVEKSLVNLLKQFQ